MNKHNIFWIGFIMALLAISPGKVFADITDVIPSGDFNYKTRKAINVDIQVNTPTGEMTGLSFYSQGVDGLRLLDTRTVDGSGHFQGKLLIPAYLNTVVVKSRWLDNFQKISVNVGNYQLNAVIDHF